MRPQEQQLCAFGAAAVLMGSLSLSTGQETGSSAILHFTDIAGETKNRPHQHRTSKWSCFFYSDARDTALETFVLSYSCQEVAHGFRQQRDLFRLVKTLKERKKKLAILVIICKLIKEVIKYCVLFGIFNFPFSWDILFTNLTRLMFINKH